MKWSIIRVGIVAMFMGMATIVLGMTDDDREQRRAERHQRKLQQYKSGWNRLIPKYQNVQYAGSMGLLSLGVGWDYGRKKQWETEIMFGLIPRFSSNKAKVTFTLKQNYAPWEVTEHLRRVKIGNLEWSAVQINRVITASFNHQFAQSVYCQHRNASECREQVFHLTFGVVSHGIRHALRCQ